MRIRISLLVVVAAIAPVVRAQEQSIPRLNPGLQLIASLGCAGCHTFDRPALSGLGKAGPDLRRIAAKTTPGWVLEWLMAPREHRPTTWMPHFFDASDRPSGGGQTDRSEARAIVAYLWDRSQRLDDPPPPAGDAARGEALYRSVGCTGCHLRDAGAARDDFTEPYRLQGPNLIGLGSKVDAAWLFAWLKDPRRYAPRTSMPSLRLSDREAADLTVFLMASRVLEPLRTAVPADGDFAPERQVATGREAIELYGCYGCHLIAGFEDADPHAGELASVEGFAGHGMTGLPDYRLSKRETEAIAAAIGSASVRDGEALVEGRKLIARYGCRGCHLIEGRGHAIKATVDDPGMLPPNLAGEGSRVQPAWLAGYLEDPGSVSLRAWLTARMPAFDFSAEEIDVLVAYFAALEDRDLALAPQSPLTARNVALGRETFDLMPCGRCHPTSAAAAKAATLDAASLAPPLDVASRRLRYEWIALWIKDPQSWLPGTGMPTFFMETRPGVFYSPFTGALGSPVFAEPRERMLEHVTSEQELEAFLNDADAVIEAIRDHVWSLGPED